MDNDKREGWAAALRSLATAPFALAIAAAVAASATLAYLTATAGAVANAFAEAPAYVLAYHENAGAHDADVTGMPDPKEGIKSYTGTFEVSGAVPERPGWRFDGWSASPDGSGTRVEPSTPEAPSTYAVPDRDVYEVHLWARWVPLNYRLRYDVNEARGGLSGAPAEQVVQLSGPSHDFEVADAPEIQGQPHRVFMGWAEDPAATVPTHGFQGSGLDADGAEVATLSATVTATADAPEVTLYAVWATRFTLRFDENAKYGGSGPVPAEMSAVRSGAASHRFTLPPESEGPVPTKAGYDFQCWSFTEDRAQGERTVKFGEYVDVAAADPDVTLWARYLPRDAAVVRFSANVPDGVSSGGVPTPEAASLNVDSPNYPIWSFALPAVQPTATGRTFLGWSRDKDAEEPEFLPGATYSMNIDLLREETLYAVWYPPHRFSISVHGNGEGVTYDWPGWNNKWPGATDNMAYWRAPEFVVTSRDMNAQTEKSLVMPGGNFRVAGSRSNYRIMGYATKPDATEDDVVYTVNQDNRIVEDITLTCDDPNCRGEEVHNIDLYAVWRPRHRVGMTFHINNPNVSTSVWDIYPHKPSGYNTYNDTATRTYTVAWSMDAGERSVAIPERGFTGASCKDATGYNFLGWSTDPNATEPDPQYAKSAMEANSGHMRFTAPISLTLEGEDTCEAGHVHSVYDLYAVWQPLHRFAIAFDPNKSGTSNSTYSSGFGFGGGSRRESWDVYAYCTPKVPVTQKTYVVPAGTAVGSFTNVTGNKLIGWSENPNATEPDPAFELDENGKFKHTIVFTDPDDDCEGGGNDNHLQVVTHVTKTLYGVWKSQHSFSITIAPNWGSGFTFQTAPEGGRTADNGYRVVTRDYDTSTNEVTIAGGTLKIKAGGRTGYKYLGLSSDPNATQPDPAYALDEDGYLINDIVLTDPNGVACAGNGENHTCLKLYVLWEPLHAFGLRFISPSGANAGSWSMDSLSSFEDSGASAYKNWYGNDGSSRTGYRPKSETQVTIPANTWTAKVDWASNTQFVGWASSEADAQAGILDPRYELNEAGQFKHDVTISCDHETCTGGNIVHYVNLYAVWKPLHTLAIRVEPGIADRIYIGGSWDNSTRYVSSPKKPFEQCTHTWEGGTLSLTATKTGYNFLGWSTDPNATDPEYTMSGGTIAEPVTATTDAHDPCAPNTVHPGITLYPVFEMSYSLSYDANGGTGAPATQTALYRRDAEGGFPASHTFDIYDDVSSGNPPRRGNYRFMGWSLSPASGALGTYGHMNDEGGANPELGRVTVGLLGTIDLDHATSRDVTLYAVWWREYIFRFHANGGTGAPENSFKYSSAPNDEIDVPATVPVRTDEQTGASYAFLGWSTDPEATEPEYRLGDEIRLVCGEDGCATIDLYAVWEAPTS